MLEATNTPHGVSKNIGPYTYMYYTIITCTCTCACKFTLHTIYMFIHVHVHVRTACVSPPLAVVCVQVWLDEARRMVYFEANATTYLEKHL